MSIDIFEYIINEKISNNNIDIFFVYIFETYDDLTINYIFDHCNYEISSIEVLFSLLKASYKYKDKIENWEFIYDYTLQQAYNCNSKYIKLLLKLKSN